MEWASDAPHAEIPVTLRTLVPLSGSGGSFTGTLTGGNGRAGGSPTQTFAFDVNIEDASGNVVTKDSSTVTATITGPEFPSGEMVSEPVVAGVATFSGLSLAQMGTYTLTIADPATVTITWKVAGDFKASELLAKIKQYVS